MTRLKTATERREIHMARIIVRDGAGRKDKRSRTTPTSIT